MYWNCYLYPGLEWNCYMIDI